MIIKNVTSADGETENNGDCKSLDMHVFIISLTASYLTIVMALCKVNLIFTIKCLLFVDSVPQKVLQQNVQEDQKR